MRFEWSHRGSLQAARRESSGLGAMKLRRLVGRLRSSLTCSTADDAAVMHSSDRHILYAARGVRGFADGFAMVTLPAYLSAIGFDAVQIGIVAATSLLGSALLTLAVGVIAARCELRRLLLIGALLMGLTGLILPSFQHIAFILLVVFFGTVNPTAGDVGMLVPVEHAMLARGVADRERTHAFARYSLVGVLATSAGALAAATPDLLVTVGVDRLTGFKSMFYGYAVFGLVSAALYSRLLRDPPGEWHSGTGLGPSRGVVFKLAALFGLDAFAGGFVVPSLLALWLFERFALSLPAASLFFFWSNVLSALSYPAAVRLAKRIGLVNTMVLTHIPSNVCLILAALVPNLATALGLLLVRSALSQMDVPTRTSYVMAIVTPAERAAAASITAVPRSLASSVSPALAGALLSTPFSGLPLVVCGCLKIAYDLSLLRMFRHIKPPEEARQPQRPHSA
jgi:MFS family permease